MNQVDISTLRAALAPYVDVVYALLLSGVSVSVGTELLKGKWFPLPVKKYPRATNIVVSIIATLVALYVSNINIIINKWWEWIFFAVVVVIVAAITYNGLLKGASGLSTQDEKGTKSIF